MARLPYIVAALLFGALVFSKFDRQTGFTSLIRFGQTWETTRLPTISSLPLHTDADSSGYDGQFYAQVAIDPTLRDPNLKTALDAPAYRARRILVPFAAHLLGLREPRFVLQTFALLNVGCWFVLAWRLFREIGDADARVRFARWFACMFSLGALESVRQSLVDVPALLFLLLAIQAQREAKTAGFTAWSALGHLAKETNVLATFALAIDRPVNARRWISLIVAVTPLAAWLVYVAYRFPEPSEAGFGNFSWPFFGIAEHLGISVAGIISGQHDGRYIFGLLAVIGLLLEAIVLWKRPALANPWWRVGVAFSLLLIVLGPWVWSGYWAACRAVLPLTFAFNLLLPTGRAFWPLWTLGNLTLLHGLWRFL